MAPPKGHPRWGGDRTGTTNKHPREIKEMILKALDSKGGWRYLAKQADANPVAFLGLLGKIMPLQVNGSGNVLLIEQLCVVANNEWQKERAKLTAPTIDAQTESIEIAAELDHEDGQQDGYAATEPVKAAETAAIGRTPAPPKSRSRARKRKVSRPTESREELLARMARMRAARKPRGNSAAASGGAEQPKALVRTQAPGTG